MEKFTRLFLLGENSPWRFLRKIGLGLILVLWTTFAFAESQVTYQLKVNSSDGCYLTTNVYSLPVTVKDFVKIKKLVWELKYTNTTDFNFIGLTAVDPAVSTLTVQQLVDGTLSINWDSATPVTLNDGAETVLFKLNFEIAGFQHQYLNANKFNFASTITWTKTDMFNDVGQCDILSDNIINGTLNVTEKWQTVTLDYAVAKCVGQLVTATVTTPENVSGMQYSFNGQSFTSTNKAEISAPSSDNQLVIKDATCISYIKKFDVSAIDPVTFTVATPVYTICPGGLGDIEIKATKGTSPYTYYVIPEEQWLAGDLMLDKLTVSDVSKLSKYTYSNYVVEMPAGTPDVPKYYWVAVQDANGCAAITGTNLLSWWKRVAVIDNKTPFLATPTANQDLMTTCYGQPDGRINFCITGGTPYKAGYNISLGGVFVKKGLCYDSNVDVICNNAPCNKAVLGPGKYEFTLSDSLGCTFTVSYTVAQPKKILFNVDHTDAGCDSPVGQLWISSVDASTGSGAVSTWKWYYTIDPTWASNVKGPFDLTTKVTDIPAGVYYVKVVDGNGCEQVWTNAAGDNAIKILTTVFSITYTPIKCSGDLTTATINLISGDANHTFQYMVEKEVCVSAGEVTTCTWNVVGTGWQTSNVFTGIAGDVNYRYSVKDVTASNCVVSWEQIIPNPPKLEIAVLTFNTRPPTCPDNNDGNISVMARGGRPWNKVNYMFSIDGSDFKAISNFAAGAGEHTITVKDSAGCTAITKVRLPGGENFINFAPVIPLACKNDSVNLFNAWPGNDHSEELGWWNYVGLDKGWLIDYSWYLWENHLGDNSAFIPMAIWTSANGWELVPFQGTIWSRNPKLYATKTSWTKKSDIAQAGNVISHSTKLAAGTYFLVAKDEWGCYSNVDTVKIVAPAPLAVTLTTEDATCFNTTTGKIQVVAKNGRFPIPMPYSGTGAKYQYVLVQQPDIFNADQWYGTQVQWIDFQNENNWANDSVLLISVKKGTYWLAIRDYCASHDPSQIIILNEIVIGGKDAITAKVTVNDAVCYGDKNGSVLVSSVAGGFGGYSIELNATSGQTGTWPVKNTTGVFNNLAAGTYTVTVKDSKGCAPYVKNVEVKQPAVLALTLKGVDASCFGAQDGILRYTITGGTGPYKESTNNGANWYAIAETTSQFDRRAGAGTYNVWIMDAHGCTTSATLTLLQPAKLAISSTVVTNVSCPPSQAVSCSQNNVINDGAIKVYWSGGWNANDVFNYYVTAKKGDVTYTQTINGPVSSSTYANFTGLTAGEWTISVYEWSPTIPYAKPYIMDPDYASHYAPGFIPTRPDAVPNPQQNPDITVCVATVKVTVGAPDPIKYTVEYLPVLCKDTPSGEIHVHNVTGGTGPYFFMLQGPSDYSANGVYKPAGTGVLEYIFTGLPFGNYNVFIKDSKGCVVCQEAGVVSNVKALTLMVSLVKNADCYNTATGQIKLEATSFPDGYTLKYAIALASDVEQYLFPLDDETFVNSLAWQDSPLFNVKSGVWIGYVKAIEPSTPSRGYCIQGHSTDKNGVRILNHRVFVDQPTQVVGTVASAHSVAALCYGDANGKIKVDAVSGGSGSGYSAHVFGTAFDGTAVSKWYSDVETGDFLDGLLASTDKKDLSKITAADSYTVVFVDSKGCLSPEYKVAVMQPVVFTIELVLKQDAFICPSDLAGVFEIRIVSGGTGTVVYKYEAWDGTTMKFSSPYGAINTFQGPAGLLYKGWAKDANGCVAYAEKFVAKPVVASFNVFDRTCYGDAGASAIVKMGVKDPARTYMVSYLKYPSTTWSAWSAAFTDSIKLTGLTYGDFSTDLGHYRFKIKDNMGCESDTKDVTFEPVQTQLKTCCATVVPGECTGTLSITITGGITPYTVFIDGKAMTGASWTLPSGQHTIHVVDAHLCTSDMNVNIDANPVSRTATAVAFIGEKVKFTDAEAKLDTMLAKGVTTVKYKYTNDCIRTLVITVTEQYRTAKISEIQGTGDVSPLKDLPRQITGTVTAVVPGVGYFVQDARDAVNGRCGIFVADTKTTVLENTGVQVGGIVRELNDVTTLEAQVVTIVTGTAYDPIVLASPADGKNEKWESVLVQVVGARFQGTVNPDGSWVIKTTETNNIMVNDWIFSYTPVDGHYYTVTGILNGANSLYKLEPRKTADVIDLTKTTPVLDVDNLQFKVYPNPFNDYLNIDNSDRLSRVTVTNIAGQRVIDIQYPERVIRTSNLVSGVYVITLFTEDGIAKSERMVKR